MVADQTAVLHYFGMPVEAAALIDSGICNVLLILICILVMNTLRYYLPRGSQFINIFCSCLFLAIAWLVLSKWLLGISLKHVTGI
jgi:hypothetical protein